MEYLDYYDEFGNHLGVETREKIHELGLWHCLTEDELLYAENVLKEVLNNVKG